MPSNTNQPQIRATSLQQIGLQDTQKVPAQMEAGGGRCSEKASSNDQVEGGAKEFFEKALPQGEAGGQGHHEKATRQNQMGGRCSEKETLEDIEWLSSLSHSHLDMLISLKELAILCAKNAGYEDVAEKFDLRMLRALGSILMESLKEGVRNASIFPDGSKGFELLSGSYSAARKNEKNCCQMTVTENIKTSNLHTRKRVLGGTGTGLQSFKRRKIGRLNL
uniref:UDP-N-acetylglucosamine--N-acetylmuramyl-(Pentapeptide) pyrophosphoryl-undecaprenol N-acetylglucosamine transferase n=1 Tax=Anthurium amnicola TaxID=1678845 RepID=A0A1D1ZHF3_9ARAE